MDNIKIKSLFAYILRMRYRSRARLLHVLCTMYIVYMYTYIVMELESDRGIGILPHLIIKFVDCAFQETERNGIRAEAEITYG